MNRWKSVNVPSDGESQRGARATRWWLSLGASLGAGCWLGCHPSPPDSTPPPRQNPPPKDETQAHRSPPDGGPADKKKTKEPARIVQFELPRAPAASDAVQARIELGSLPIGARLVVRTMDGAIAGTLVEYGPKRPGETSVRSIPIPRGAVSGRQVTLRLEVHTKSPEATRAPTDSEVVGVKVVLVESTSTKDR